MLILVGAILFGFGALLFSLGVAVWLLGLANSWRGRTHPAITSLI
jgi:hypothetical protein